MIPPDSPQQTMYDLEAAITILEGTIRELHPSTPPATTVMITTATLLLRHAHRLIRDQPT